MENKETRDKLITVEVKNVRHAKRLYTLARVTFGVATFLIGALDHSVASIIAFVVLLLISVFIETAADDLLDSLHHFFKLCMHRIASDKSLEETIAETPIETQTPVVPSK